MTDAATETFDEEATFCAVHPDRETGLRCNLCGRYMCSQCAVSTPIGYRCRECVRKVDDKFFSGTNTDYLIAAVVPLVVTTALVFVGNAIGLIHIWLVGFFLGVAYGGLLSQLMLKALNKRRGRYTGIAGAAGVIAGAALGSLLIGWLTSIGVWVLAGIAASVVYGRFR